MGFGISDEVMEKIRDSMWGNPNTSFADYPQSSRPMDPHPSHYRDRSSQQQFYYPPANNTVRPTYTALTEQELFLASSFYAVHSAINKERLKSENY